MVHLERESLADDPFVQFERWFSQAQREGVAEPEAMALSTVDAAGAPSSRMVLLRGFDRAGFVFFSNYGSRKAQDILARPRAALLFYWRSEPARQVRIVGEVEKTTPRESLAYFRTRPRGSRLGAWASPQSRAIQDRETLEAAQREMERISPEEVPLPPFWGGYRLAPQEFEFWQAGADRLHDRFRYFQAAGVWSIERLAP
ncbi:pyridoxamine 5'-phosphate oxidase [bacterium]|nr:pyridoxamine 5'-phosphate oxidase [bacterium]